MSTTNHSNKPNLRLSNWLIVPEELVDQILGRAHAAYHPDKDRWIKDTRNLISFIRYYPVHSGQYLLMAEDFRFGDDIHEALSLRESLDYLAYETIWFRMKHDVPADWDEVWRHLACKNLLELIIKHQQEAVRKSATEIWENYWREVQQAQRLLPPTSDQSPS